MYMYTKILIYTSYYDVKHILFDYCLILIIILIFLYIR